MVFQKKMKLFLPEKLPARKQTRKTNAESTVLTRSVSIEGGKFPDPLGRKE